MAGDESSHEAEILLTLRTEIRAAIKKAKHLRDLRGFRYAMLVTALEHALLAAHAEEILPDHVTV